MPRITIIIINLVLCTAWTAAVPVPFLANVILVPLSNSSSVTLTNRTCDECLCAANSSHTILNCFPNATCQFFVDAPRTYKLQSTANARLYFPQQVLPNPSQCYTSYLLDKLTTATAINASVNGSRCLILDNHGYLVTVSEVDNTILRFYPNNLTRVDPLPLLPFVDHPFSIVQHQGAYYVGFNTYILVVDSNNMTQINNISTPSLNVVRDVTFLNGGQQMIVVSSHSDLLVIFNRSSVVSYDYHFIGSRIVSGHNPHCLFFFDESTFYLSSWNDNTVYRYLNAGNATTWTETLVLNASSVTSVSAGNHITIDACGRYWFSLGPAGVKIFDGQGLLLGSFYIPGSYIFDALILDNFVIYLSDPTLGRITRIDTNI